SGAPVAPRRGRYFHRVVVLPVEYGLCECRRIGIDNCFRVRVTYAATCRRGPKGKSAGNATIHVERIRATIGGRFCTPDTHVPPTSRTSPSGPCASDASARESSHSRELRQAFESAAS